MKTKNEIIDFVKANFNYDELSELEGYDAFKNMHITMSTYAGVERWIGYCDCVVRQMDGRNSKWIVDFINDYKDNMCVMSIIDALKHGVTERELIMMFDII